MPTLFNPLNTNAIAATATSQSRLFPTGDGQRTQVSIYNAGPNDVFVEFGDSTVVATFPALNAAIGAQGNATPIPAYAVIGFSNNPAATHWAAICAGTGTANVYITMGEGL